MFVGRKLGWIRQSCNGYLPDETACENINEIALTTGDVLIGVLRAKAYPDVVMLAPCPNCGSIEQIGISWQALSPSEEGSVIATQRAVRNWMAKVLVDGAHITTGCATAVTTKWAGGPPPVIAADPGSSWETI